MSASRIQHVVVLMFENRSFDHLLGLLSDDPDHPGVRLGDDRFSNPVDPSDPAQGRVPVTDDAVVGGLAVDPPHSHAGAVEQLGLRGGKARLLPRRRRGSEPRMDGFVSACRRKLAGREEGLPVVHWERLHGVAAVGSVAVAAVLALPPTAPLAAGAATLLGAAEAVVGMVHRRRRLLPPISWTRAAGGPVAVVGMGAAASVALGRRFGYGARLAALAAGLGGCTGAAVHRKRRAVTHLPAGAAGEAALVMACMRPEKVPALATLASSFALCTRWHCSVPGATWPNRNFAHAGTSDGTVDIEIGLYDNVTIFQRLQEAGRTWAIYRDGRSLAQAMAFRWLSDDAQIGCWRRLDEFAGDVAAGRLATYSFLEPCHEGPHSNSQHPGNNDHRHRPPEGGLWDFERGENLLIEVYEALRRHPDVFASTLLVVTYDEHGGLYDHVPPPTDAVEPEPLGTPRRSWLPRLLGWFVEQPESRFRFTVLGPRVPAVVVSPLVPPRRDPTVYDHTAIPRTLRALFAPASPPLSAREAASPSLAGLASLDEPRTDLPDLSGLIKWAARGAVAAAAPARDDDLTRQLRQLGALLRPRVQPPATRSAAAAAAAGDDDVAALFTAKAEAHRPR